MPVFNNSPHVPGPPRPIQTKVSEDHSIKRKFEDPNFLGPPCKRSFDGSFSIPPSIPLPTNSISVQHEIPDHMVGLIIGAGGQTIINLQNETCCEVQVAANSSGKPRPLTIIGSPENVDNCRRRIDEMIEEHGGYTTNERVNTIDIIVPAAKAGLIIGTGGATIKSLMEKSKAKMYLIQDSNHNTGMDKPLKITGDPDAVAEAERLVMDLIQQGGAPPYIEIPVPKFAVGMIIGNQGSTIKKLQEDHNVRVQFKPESNEMNPQRICQILGDAESAQGAARDIKEIVSNANAKDKAKGIVHHQDPSENNFVAMPTTGMATVIQMTVPQSKAGLVIGKGGEVIKQLKQQSGAMIELNKHAKVTPTERVFKIQGSPYQVAKGQHVIKQVIGEVPKYQQFMSEEEFYRQNQSDFDSNMFSGNSSGNQSGWNMSQYNSQWSGNQFSNSDQYQQMQQWMQQWMQKSGGGQGNQEYMAWYMDYMKKCMEYMQSMSSNSKDANDYMQQYMDYMKKMSNSGDGAAMWQGMSNQHGHSSNENMMEQWMNYYKQMSQQ